jgi:hypothetical protein
MWVVMSMATEIIASHGLAIDAIGFDEIKVIPTLLTLITGHGDPPKGQGFA